MFLFASFKIYRNILTGNNFIHNNCGQQTSAVQQKMSRLGSSARVNCSAGLSQFIHGAILFVFAVAVTDGIFRVFTAAKLRNCDSFNKLVKENFRAVRRQILVP